jgi:hypothetical protein
MTSEAAAVADSRVRAAVILQHAKDEVELRPGLTLDEKIVIMESAMKEAHRELGGTDEQWAAASAGLGGIHASEEVGNF